MTLTTIKSEPVWRHEDPNELQPPLQTDVSVDVCVVGAGIAGMTTAYLLAKQGQSVVVLDDGRVGGGQTGHTTAHLASAIDDRFVRIAQLHGEEGAALAADSHASAIDRIESIVRQEKIDCHFERLDGYLIAAPGDESMIDREFEAAHRARVQGVERLAAPPLQSFGMTGCLRFPRQGQFHPLKYLAGLSQAFRRLGGKLYNGTHATKIEGGKQATIAPARARR